MLIKTQQANGWSSKMMMIDNNDDKNNDHDDHDDDDDDDDGDDADINTASKWVGSPTALGSYFTR